MFIRTFIGFAILLLVSQASVGASTNPTNCGEGTARCCEEVRSVDNQRDIFALTCVVKDSSRPGSVNDEQCQSYSVPCASGYMPACCYIVSSVVSDIN
jgi:hypothetical protein